MKIHIHTGSEFEGKIFTTRAKMSSPIKYTNDGDGKKKKKKKLMLRESDAGNCSGAEIHAGWPPTPDPPFNPAVHPAWTSSLHLYIHKNIPYISIDCTRHSQPMHNTNKLAFTAICFLVPLPNRCGYPASDLWCYFVYAQFWITKPCKFTRGIPPELTNSPSSFATANWSSIYAFQRAT